MVVKAERGKLFSLEDELSENSNKQDGIGWSRWNSYVLKELEKTLDPQESLDTFHEYTKLKRSNAYESGMSAVQCAADILGQNEKPMATLIRE